VEKVNPLLDHRGLTVSIHRAGFIFSQILEFLLP
jgi:hypothetical protein